MNYRASWAGADNRRGVKIKQQMRLLLVCSFAASFRKTALNSDFICFFYDFIHAGAGADNSYGVNFKHHRKLLHVSL